MSTTGNAGRPDPVREDPADEPVRLACARRLFVRLAEGLDAEIGRLARLRSAGAKAAGVKAMKDLIRDTQRALLTVLEFEMRLERRQPDAVEGALDLEAARAEITGRLARLAERG